MPTISSAKARIKLLISNIKDLYTLISSETKANAQFLLKGIKVYNLSDESAQFNTYVLPLKFEETLNIKTVNPIYVLVREFLNSQTSKDIGIHKYNIRCENFIINKFDQLSILPKFCNHLIKSFIATFKKYDNLIFSPTLGSIDDLKIEIPNNHSLLIEPIKKPDFFREPVDFVFNIAKKSDTFAANLLIEKKPQNLLLFSGKELEFFKDQLAQKFNVSKNKVKLTSIYSKLIIKNLQNIKYDASSHNVYCNFKQKHQLVADNTGAYLVLGIRKDNNTSLSTLVMNSEFEQFKNS